MNKKIILKTIPYNSSQNGNFRVHCLMKKLSCYKANNRCVWPFLKTLLARLFQTICIFNVMNDVVCTVLHSTSHISVGVLYDKSLRWYVIMQYKTLIKFSNSLSYWSQFCGNMKAFASLDGYVSHLLANEALYGKQLKLLSSSFLCLNLF